MWGLRIKIRLLHTTNSLLCLTWIISEVKLIVDTIQEFVYCYTLLWFIVLNSYIVGNSNASEKFNNKRKLPRVKSWNQWVLVRRTMLISSGDSKDIPNSKKRKECNEITQIKRNKHWSCISFPSFATVQPLVTIYN